MSKKISSKLKGRIFFFILYFFISIFLMTFFNQQIFNTSIKITDWNIYYRLVWCFASGLLGFSLLIFFIVVYVIRGKFEDQNPFPTYLTYYPFLILVISCIIFSVLNIFYETLGVLFYAASFSLCFFFCFNIDGIGKFVDAALSKLTK